MKATVFTSNQDKMAWLQKRFPELEVLYAKGLPEYRIAVQNEETVKEALVKKAHNCYHNSILMGQVVDDFYTETLSIEVPEWNGWPGLYTGDCVEQLGLAKFCAMIGDRTCYMSSYWTHRTPDGNVMITYGSERGKMKLGETMMDSFVSQSGRQPRETGYQSMFFPK